MTDPTSQPSDPLNLCLIYQTADGLAASLNASPKKGQTLIVTDDDGFLADWPDQIRLDFTAAGLDDIPIRFDNVRDRLAKFAAGLRPELRPGSAPGTQVVVDMRWGLGTVSASANFDRWGGQCEQIIAALGHTVISAYGRSMLIEDQLITALRGHSHFLAPSGQYANPYWVPPEVLNGATLTQQADFLLGRLVPDYANLGSGHDSGDGAASGADPHWINSPRQIQPGTGSDEIWKIRCFGRLRIYLSDGSQVRWALPGSSPKKSKALFAFLLQRGERGARSEQLAELLWGEEPNEAVKRARLHHAITMLRKTLGGRKFVVRTGEYYNLMPPPGTWIDISSFEQLCQRAKVMAKSGQSDDAITLLDAADRLYTGELFEDLLPDYIESDIEDWVVPRRTWLREMALKVQRDKAEILRHKGRLREALECCQKALSMDPTCEIAHAEAMRIFSDQNRLDTVTRQYRQYRNALDAIGADSESGEVDDLYRKITKDIQKQNSNPAKEKPK